MLLGAYLLPGVVVAFPAGLLGRRVSEKTLGLAGLVLMAVSGLALSYSGDLTAALVARLVGGVGATDRRPGRDQDGGGLVRAAARSCWRCRCCR